MTYTVADARPPTILVVDDEPDVQTLIQTKFRGAIRADQIRFHFALNGREALALLQEHEDIDVVVSDVNMPEMDGFAMLEELQRRFPLVKTVMLSAYSGLDKVRQAMQGGAFDYIVKPIDFDDFTRSIGVAHERAVALRGAIRTLRETGVLAAFTDETVAYLGQHTATLGSAGGDEG